MIDKIERKLTLNERITEGTPLNFRIDSTPKYHDTCLAAS